MPKIMFLLLSIRVLRTQNPVGENTLSLWIENWTYGPFSFLFCVSVFLLLDSLWFLYCITTVFLYLLIIKLFHSCSCSSTAGINFISPCFLPLIGYFCLFWISLDEILIHFFFSNNIENIKAYEFSSECTFGVKLWDFMLCSQRYIFLSVF
jgi:hypothetical protein